MGSFTCMGDTTVNHVCPDCGSQMLLKDGRRGQFYTCPNWAKNKSKGKCITTFDGDSSGGGDEFETASPTASDFSSFARVDWTDGTLRRAGWKARYAGVGASLRSVNSSFPAQFNSCWVAWSDLPSFEPADSDTRRVLGMFLKLLTRGDAPPLHPQSEFKLLKLLGKESSIVGSRIPGDIAPRLKNSKPISFAETIPPVQNDVVIDEFGDSDEEIDFLKTVKENWPDIARWVIPQASFDLLLRAHGIETGSCRRCDFMFNPPGVKAFVVEIDGLQHAAQSLSDEERDGALSSAGFETIRISTSELRANSGAGLQRFAELLKDVEKPRNEFDKLFWAPIQTHRLLLALIEGCARGFLAGNSWVIRVEDPTELAVELIGPYLEVLFALDSLWGNKGVAPERVTFSSNGTWTTYLRNEEGNYSSSEDQAYELDLVIKLEAGNTPVNSLPPFSGNPEIVVRSAATPVQIANPPVGTTERIPVRATSEQARRALVAILQAVFAKKDFLQGQYEALSEVLEGRDCTVLLPTGAGKSIIYQMAGLCLPGRTLVIDPINALIDDQMGGLKIHGIDRTIGISSITTKQGLGKALLSAVSNADAYFIFISPERMKSQAFRSALREMTSLAPVNLVVIDEAHCVSEWGHDFRTAYLGLGSVLRDHCKDSAGKPPPLLALTGTASRAVLRDVLFQLGMIERTANSVIRPKTFDRKELNYRIKLTTPENAGSDLRGVIKSLPTLFGESPQTFFEPDGENTYSGLIFCPTVNGYHGVVDTSDEVKSVIPSTRIYAGSQPKKFGKINWDEAKRSNASSFKNNQITALVTTVAFGMGIDKPNIRWVVHYGLPKSIESYYQEVGRAGRDRREAQCTLILTEFDEARNQSLLSEAIDLETARAANDVKKAAKDDVVQSMWFHLETYGGIEGEHLGLKQVASILEPASTMRKLSLPFAGDQKGREKSLHRLTLLGVIADYTVEWGSSEFIVTVNGVTPDAVVNNLLNFVERSQPGRADALSQRVNREYSKVLEAIDVCGLALMEFVYDTIERSRRRSLREMWLAARESASKGSEADAELRTRILDFLSEGDLMPGIEKLLDNQDFSFSNWERMWSTLNSANDAREWRAATARLLASYPTHPGLLAGRALAEFVDPEGSLAEFEFNILLSLEESSKNYGANYEDLIRFGKWLIEKAKKNNPAGIGAICAVLEYSGLQFEELDRAILEENNDDDLALSLLVLNRKVNSALLTATNVLNQIY